MTLNDILNASFGETSNILRVNFKKTLLIRQYETEVVEGSSEVTVDRPITGAERAFITALMRAQIEYQIYADLFVKGTVTRDEYAQKVNVLETSMTSIKNKAEEVIGKSLDSYLKNSCIETNVQ